jgi:hypothetical protein
MDFTPVPPLGPRSRPWLAGPLATLVLGLTACGHGAPSRDAVACRLPDADALRCMDFVQMKFPDMRLAAQTQCREQGGIASDHCPQVSLVGICERFAAAAGGMTIGPARAAGTCLSVFLPHGRP